MDEVDIVRVILIGIIGIFVEVCLVVDIVIVRFVEIFEVVWIVNVFCIVEICWCVDVSVESDVV